MARIGGLTLTGDAELVRALDRFAGAVVNRVLRKMMDAGAAPIVRAMRANLRALLSSNTKREGGRAPGDLLGSLRLGKVVRTYATGRTGRRDIAVAVIGPQWPKGAIGWIFEHGTARRSFDGQDRGTMPAQPFLRTALDANRQNSVAAMAAKGKETIEAEARKVAA